MILIMRMGDRDNLGTHNREGGIQVLGEGIQVRVVMVVVVGHHPH